MVTFCMDSYKKNYYEEHFHTYLNQLLSIHFKKIGVEDFTKTNRYQFNTGGEKYRQWCKENASVLELAERLRTAFRHSMSKW